MLAPFFIVVCFVFTAATIDIDDTQSQNIACSIGIEGGKFHPALLQRASALGHLNTSSQASLGFGPEGVHVEMETVGVRQRTGLLHTVPTGVRQATGLQHTVSTGLQHAVPLGPQILHTVNGANSLVLETKTIAHRPEVSLQHDNPGMVSPSQRAIMHTATNVTDILPGPMQVKQGRSFLPKEEEKTRKDEKKKKKRKDAENAKEVRDEEWGTYVLFAASIALPILIYLYANTGKNGPEPLDEGADYWDAQGSVGLTKG